MIDFHSHILPGIDDGSRNMEETARLLKMEHQQGVETVVATPHFYADSDSVSHFLKKRSESFAEVSDFADQQRAQGEDWMPKIIVGAEVYYFPEMGKADLLPSLCLEGTSLILLEMPFAQWTKSMYEDISRIIKKQKLTVILAHIERYYPFQKDKSIWQQVFELPLYAQINAGSFQDRKKRKFNLKFIDTGFPVLLGSDCHNTEYRKPNLADGRAVLKEKSGGDVLKSIDELGERLLGAYV